MSPEDVEARLVELETRLAFQENALTDLGEALTAMRLENARYSDLLKRALEELKAGRGPSPGSSITGATKVCELSP